MNADSIFDIMAGLVLVAMATTIVSHRNTATVITAFGNAFSRSLRAAQGG